ncbi:MAG: MBL fold metallo-hydrolase [Planctomycetes bacterium]|nr:MBL fold metallo-hydrolase [Planctomycetota bacterium]
MGKNRSRGFRRLEENDLARLTFLGASGEVTGSSYLLETRAERVLFDCGMCQGEVHSKGHNQRPFPFDAGGLDRVVLTHAHVDHSGLLPKLVRDGFRGKIHATTPSGELLGVLLRDSAHIHEQDTKYENRLRQRRGKPLIEPLYDVADAESALGKLVLHPFDAPVELSEHMRLRFVRAGHILGAASVECWIRNEGVERKVVFSGDLGRKHEPLLRPPEPPSEADLVLMESTYGDRDHKKLDDTVEELAQALREATKDGGNVLIPVFAVGRAQEILHYIAELEHKKCIPELPVFLDSPMAIRATELYRKYADCFGLTLAGARCEAREPRRLEFCRTPDESMALNSRRGIVILSSSGMCEGGRILHHLRHNLWRSSTDVVIVGFQARGTLGRALVEGARSVRIFGEPVAVAAKVHTLGGFSAHAGQTELIEWVRAMASDGARIVLVHGEAEKRAVLAAKIEERLGVQAWQPLRGDQVLLQKSGAGVSFVGAQRALAR